ncbi:MAG: O-antigen ligase family protein [Sphingomonadales bacterium]
MKTTNPSKANKPAELVWHDTTNWPPLILIMLYALVEFIPNFEGADVMGAQWLYLSGVHLLTGLYLLTFGKNLIKSELGVISGNVITWLLVCFVALAGLSMLWAINQVESLVTYARLLTTVLIFFQVGILLAGRWYLLKPLSYFFAFTLLIQSVDVIDQFFSGINEGQALDAVVGNLKINSGNKNILAATLAIKFGLCILALLESPRLVKWLISAVLTMTVIALAMVNARASYISIAAQSLLLVVFSLLAMARDKNWKLALSRIAFVIIPVVLGYFLSTAILQSAIEEQEKPTGYSTIAERAKTITFETSGRNNLWLSAIDYIKKHPFKGAGYGNWKLASIPYEKEHINELFVAYHSHNDFLEMTTETGWIGGLLYFSMFVLASFWLLRIFLDQKATHLFSTAIFLTMALASYFTDAMFNFPVERPGMQFFLAFTLASILQLHLAHRKLSVATSSIRNLRISPDVYALICIVALGFSAFFNSKVYESMRGQYYINQDMLKAEPSLDFEKVNKDLPSIPNLNAFCFPIRLIKARYLMKAQKHQEALALLEKCREESPKLSINEFYTAQCHLALNQKDSAFYWAIKAFEYRPRVRNNFVLLNQLLLERKDSLQLEKNFAIVRRLRNEDWAWNSFLAAISGVGVSPERYKMLLDSALTYFPKDEVLNARRNDAGNAKARPYFEAAGKAFSQGDYRKAIENFKLAQVQNPFDYAFDENIGLCYHSLGDFTNSIKYFDKVIAGGKARDAKSYVFRGLGLISLGRKDEGCASLRMAVAQKYPGAADLLKSNCGN